MGQVPVYPPATEPVGVARLRFFLDEHLSPRIAEIARGLGVDVTSVVERGTAGLSDEEQLSAAAADGRGLVTQDRADFLALTVTFFSGGRPHAGIALVPSSLPTNYFTGIARAIAHLAAAHANDDLAYAIVYLSRPPDE